MALKRTKSQNAIERIHVRLMNLRDSLPIYGDDAAERAENIYRRSYIMAYRHDDLEGFKSAAKRYRNRLRAAAKNEQTRLAALCL